GAQHAVRRVRAPQGKERERARGPHQHERVERLPPAEDVELAQRGGDQRAEHEHHEPEHGRLRFARVAPRVPEAFTGGPLCVPEARTGDEYEGRPPEATEWVE